MTARDINSLIRSSIKVGLNVYAKTKFTLICKSATRIVKAREKDDRIQVKTLNSGQWVELLDDQIYAQ